MIDETLEFRLTQYLDGDLAPAERAEMETILARDAAARELLDEYRRLDAVVKAGLPRMPAVNWDRLAQELSLAIDEEQAAATRRIRPAADAAADTGSTYRIGAWFTNVTRMAIAAAVVLVMAVGLKVYQGGTTTPSGKPVGPGIAKMEPSIEGPKAEVALGPVVADVEIGPPTLAQSPSRSADSYGVETLVSSPSRIEVFASESSSAQDSVLPNY